MLKILIAPLDWGLGHATRVIPVIRYLKNCGCEVIIASNNAQQKLLQTEFPFIQQISLKGYNINYAKNKRFFSLKILLQIPKVLYKIYLENKWLKKIIAQHKIDAVISDNRYGLWSDKIPCIFITHQLQIEAPYKWMKKLLRQINYSFINRFTECWVPDFENEPNIAGILSHPSKLPKTTVKYIGILSRFKIQLIEEKKYHWLIVLSGPEPQRTALENKLLKIIPQLEGKILMIRGKPESSQQRKVTDNCNVINHLPTMQMQQAFQQSEFIISRSGYTTVMEILSLKKKSILIPTPGQTEQEYLSKNLMQQNWCYSFEQTEINFLEQFKNAEKFHYKFPDFSSGSLQKTINNFLKDISNKNLLVY